MNAFGARHRSPAPRAPAELDAANPPRPTSAAIEVSTPAARLMRGHLPGLPNARRSDALFIRRVNRRAQLAMPASNSWRANALAGATTAMRSPGRRARVSRALDESRHFGSHCLVLVIPSGAELSVSGRGCAGARKRSFARRLERILDALERRPPRGESAPRVATCLL
jgi:hypothetical protein